MSEIKLNPEDPENMESILGVEKTFQLELRSKIAKKALSGFLKRNSLLELLKSFQEDFSKEEILYLGFTKFLEEARDLTSEKLSEKLSHLPDPLKEKFMDMAKDLALDGKKATFVEIPEGQDPAEFIKNFVNNLKSKETPQEKKSSEKDNRSNTL